MDRSDLANCPKNKGFGNGNDACIVSFDSPFALSMSKVNGLLRTGFGYVPRLNSVTPARRSGRYFGVQARNRLDPNRNGCLPVGRGFVTVTCT